MTARDLAAWWWLVITTSVRDGWEWLPGPWPVKILLLVVLAAGQLIPGEVDELAVLALLAWWKRHRTRRAGERP